MKYIFTLLLLASFFTSKAQTPQCLVYHGCGGATVVAYQGDLGWSSITYDFQRFQGGSWVTIHQSIENFHLVIPGDIVVATQYRTILRNNATSEERISNGVTVDPAKFNDAVVKPKPVITFYWGTVVTSGANYVEVLPKAGNIDGMRPPFTYKIGKQNGPVYDIKISTTGIFFTNFIEASQNYIITVTDYCGQTDSVAGAFGFGAFGRVTNRNCSGASIEFSSVTTGQNTSHRQPVSFGLAALDDSIPSNLVPQSILAGINYSYAAGISSGFTGKRYVVRAKDAFGVLSDYSVVSTGLAPPNPFIVSIGPSTGYCNYFITLAGNYVESGIRKAGDNQPYTFTPGTTITGIRGGFSYEIVVKDSCGNISLPLLQNFTAFQPRITNVTVTRNGCSNSVTVTATSCTNNPEYRLQLFGEPAGNWQSSNVFTNVPGIAEYHKVFVRDGNSPMDSNFVYVPPFSARLEVLQFNGLCGSLGNIRVSDVFEGVPPYQYAISYDGINFSPFSFNGNFTNLVPGTYDFKVKDSCGNIFRATEDFERQIGDWFYINETGFQTVCSGGNEQAGGFIRVGIQQSINNAPNLPYKYEVKEVTDTINGVLQYGKVIRRGETNDTAFTVSGLSGNKRYGIFITNGCGEISTEKVRTVNNYLIPAGVLPEPLIAINATTCNEPFFEFSGLPAGGIIEIFKGDSLAGTPVLLATPATSVKLLGGNYTIRVSTSNYEGCTWQEVYHRFVATNDSISTGEQIPELRNICRAITSVIKLRDLFTGQTPGGMWSAVPDIIWVNQDSGTFIPALQADGEYQYQFTYEVRSLCNSGIQETFYINIKTALCSIGGGIVNVESAASALGCKNYVGDRWYDILDNEGYLRYSINPGADNEINGACWGARNVYTDNPPRSTTIDGSVVYFADRNFYIEPGTINIGANPVRIRLYYDQFEINRLLNFLKNNGFPSATVNDLRILKKRSGAGSPVDLDIAFNGGSSTSLYNVITPTVHPFVPGLNYYFEFEVNSFSELALVYTIGNVLPVTWLSVTGNMTNDKAIVQWSTASEYNTASFTIEHSVDGSNFTALHSMPAAGNSNRIKNYQFTHLQPSAGINFYRIKQFDKDGRYSYSSIIKILNRRSDSRIVIAPNPASNIATVFFDNPMAAGNLRLFNSSGQIVFTLRIPEGSQQQKIDVSKLPSGIYQLQVQTATTVETFKLMKQ